MLIFRVVCAIMVAWAMNWVLARPEAAALVAEIPQMTVIGPAAGALAGFFILANRRGWGLIISAANGMWTGLLTIGLAGFIYLTMRMFNIVWHNLVKDFDAFMRVLGSESEPLIVVSTDFRLIGLTVAVTAVTGIISEVLHWCLVRIRRMRGEEEEPKVQVKAAVAKAGGPMS